MPLMTHADDTTLAELVKRLLVAIVQIKSGGRCMRNRSLDSVDVTNVD